MKMTNRIFHTQEWKRVTSVLKTMTVKISKTKVTIMFPTNTILKFYKWSSHSSRTTSVLCANKFLWSEFNGGGENDEKTKQVKELLNVHYFLLPCEYAGCIAEIQMYTMD
jgi:hypothetical protein